MLLPIILHYLKFPEPPKHHHQLRTNLSEHEHFEGTLHILNHGNLVSVSCFSVSLTSLFPLITKTLLSPETLPGQRRSGHAHGLCTTQKIHIFAVFSRAVNRGQGSVPVITKIYRRLHTRVCPLSSSVAEIKLTPCPHFSCHLAFCGMSAPLQSCPSCSLALSRYS